jgi:hypothetical protein
VEVCVSQHVFEDGVKFLVFVAERMRNVAFPGWFDDCGQAGPEATLMEANQEQAGVAAVGSEFAAGGAGLAADEALAPESAQVTRELTLPAHEIEGEDWRTLESSSALRDEWTPALDLLKSTACGPHTSQSHGR